MNYYMNSLNNSYLAVHTDALCANVAAIEKTLSPGAEIIPVLKCDAYGLSLSLTAPALAALPGIRTFALAHVSEGLALRALGIEKDALILGNPLPHAVPDAVNAHLTLTAGRLGLLPALAAAAEAAQTEVKIQIKIDTGLHRVGVTPGDELEALLKELSAAGERIKLAGVYSHFADTAKPELCRAQAELLLRSAEQIERAGEPRRGGLVLHGRQRHAAAVVVREDDGARAVLQRKLGEPAGVHFGGIHRAAAYRRAVNGTLPRIEQQRIDGLLRLVHKPRDEIVSRSLGGIDRLVRRRLVEQVPAADLRDEPEKRHGVLADARHSEQLLLVCLQHGGKRAEPLEKRVSHAVRIAPGRGIKEQQLQGVYVVEVFETVAAEAFLHPRAGAVVAAHFPRPLFFLILSYPICFSSGIVA